MAILSPCGWCLFYISGLKSWSIRERSSDGKVHDSGSLSPNAKANSHRLPQETYALKLSNFMNKLATGFTSQVGVALLSSIFIFSLLLKPPIMCTFFCCASRYLWRISSSVVILVLPFVCIDESHLPPFFFSHPTTLLLLPVLITPLGILTPPLSLIRHTPRFYQRPLVTSDTRC